MVRELEPVEHLSRSPTAKPHEAAERASWVLIHHGALLNGPAHALSDAGSVVGVGEERVEAGKRVGDSGVGVHAGAVSGEGT